MVNINVIGRLGADAETLDGKKGKFVSFRLAVPDFKNSEKTTTWFRVTFNGERALRLAQYLKKGSMVSIHGTESVDTYEDRNGATQISRDINAFDVDFVSVGNGNQSQGESTVAEEQATTGTLRKPEVKTEPQAVAAPKAVAAPPVEDNDDDLPF